MLFRDANFNIPFGLGFNLDGFISKQKTDDIIIKESVYSLGIGAWINFEVNFSRTFGIYLGSKVIYDFYYKLNNKAMITETHDGYGNCFSVIPALGVLWRF